MKRNAETFFETSRRSLSLGALTSEEEDEEEKSEVLLCKRRSSAIAKVMRKRNGALLNSISFGGLTSEEEDEEEKSEVLLRKRHSSAIVKDMRKRNGALLNSISFGALTSEEEDEEEKSEVLLRKRHSSAIVKDMRKRNGALLNSISFGALTSEESLKAQSSEDEGEEEMSMVSFYKYSKKPIGFGAFGTCVYSGENTKDHRKVAIKKVNCHTQRQTRQYKREVKYLLVLSGCPNVVKYLDVVVKQNVVYIMLELMEGTLETLVNQPNLMHNIKFTEVCYDIISALNFLHNQSNKTIIHRDIKPRNILFVSSPRLMLKLADFGLSKMLDSDSSSIGYNGGTRCWMAPEVHRSLDQFSTASDVFAAGLVLHYLMTSKHQFAPTDVECNKDNHLLVEHEIVHNILYQNVNVDSTLSSEAVHLIKLMVNHDRDQRPDAERILVHPFFWSNQKKMKFLEATANQPEIFQKGGNDFKKDLALTQLETQFQTVPWSEQSPTMIDIYNEMMMPGRRKYNTTSVAELLRFMRNAYQHVSEPGRTTLFQEYLLKDFIFFKEFKSLLIDVYEVVQKHKWDQKNKEIMYTMSS